MQLSSALMVSPAKIYSEQELVITNNLDEEANYIVESECAEIAESGFDLNPTEKQRVLISPKCKGYVEIKEESERAINKFNIPVEYKRTIIKQKPSLLWPFIAFCIVAIVLIFVGRKIIKSKV